MEGGRFFNLLSHKTLSGAAADEPFSKMIACVLEECKPGPLFLRAGRRADVGRAGGSLSPGYGGWEDRSSLRELSHQARVPVEESAVVPLGLLFPAPL